MSNVNINEKKLTQEEIEKRKQYDLLNLELDIKEKKLTQNEINKRTEQIEKRKQNALFNLDFDEYKKEVKNKFKIDNTPQNYLEKIQNLQFPDNKCKKDHDNTFLTIAIMMIIFAIILIFIY
jgi:hypothetical protein